MFPQSNVIDQPARTGARTAARRFFVGRPKTALESPVSHFHLDPHPWYYPRSLRSLDGITDGMAGTVTAPSGVFAPAISRSKYAQCSFMSQFREIRPPNGSGALCPIQYIEAGSFGIFHGYLQRPSPDGWSFPAFVRFQSACLQCRQFFISQRP